MKFALAFVALAASANAFAPVEVARPATALYDGPVIGAGGMADTRDPDAFVHEDARKSISEAPSFEEYLKMRDGGAAAAPAAAAPAAAAPGMCNFFCRRCRFLWSFWIRCHQPFGSMLVIRSQSIQNGRWQLRAYCDVCRVKF